MNTAKNFERLNLKTVSQVLYCAIEKQKQAAELVKKAQRESLWNKSQQLNREQFSKQNLCHAHPTHHRARLSLHGRKNIYSFKSDDGGRSYLVAQTKKPFCITRQSKYRKAFISGTYEHSNSTE